MKIHGVVSWKTTSYLIKTTFQHILLLRIYLPNGNCNWSSKLSDQKTRTFVLEWTGGEWRRALVCLRPAPLVPVDDEAEGFSRSNDKVRVFSVLRPTFPVLSEILRSYQPEQKTNDKMLIIYKVAVLWIQSYKCVFHFTVHHPKWVLVYSVVPTEVFVVSFNIQSYQFTN